MLQQTIVDRIVKISDNRNFSIFEMPTMARVELTARCSLACSYCYSKELKCQKKRQQFLSKEDFDLYISVIQKIPSIKEIGLFYLGESGLHQDLAYFYKKIKDAGYFTFLTTNGTVSKYILDAIPYIDSLKMSWNYKDLNDFKVKTGSSEQMFNQIHSNSLIFYQKCHELHKPFAISTILDTKNQNEYFEILKTFSYDEHYWIPLQSQCGYVKTGFDGCIGEYKNSVKPIPCWSLFKGLYIDVDGNVHTCTYGHEGCHILYNVHDQKEFKLTEKIIKMRQQHLNNQIPIECKKCLINQSI